MALSRGRQRQPSFRACPNSLDKLLIQLSLRASIPIQAGLDRAGMDIYLPIANLSVNALIIILLGGGVGLLSGLFGVGGGFLTTPLLIFYGIPPTVAAASGALQVTGTRVRN